MKELAARYTYTSDGRLISKVTGNYGDTYVNNWGYRRVTWDRGKLGRVREYAHRLVWFMHYGDIPEGLMVDHINLDRCDNRIENLRLVDKSGNAQNSKWKGYFWAKREGEVACSYSVKWENQTPRVFRLRASRTGCLSSSKI
ncbi:hypothetical protein RCIP0099_00042 [Klebsiella phage RCIP0099]